MPFLLISPVRQPPVWSFLHSGWDYQARMLSEVKICENAKAHLCNFYVRPLVTARSRESSWTGDGVPLVGWFVQWWIPWWITKSFQWPRQWISMGPLWSIEEWTRPACCIPVQKDHVQKFARSLFWEDLCTRILQGNSQGRTVRKNSKLRYKDPFKQKTHTIFVQGCMQGTHIMEGARALCIRILYRNSCDLHTTPLARSHMTFWHPPTSKRAQKHTTKPPLETQVLR